MSTVKGKSEKNEHPFFSRLLRAMEKRGIRSRRSLAKAIGLSSGTISAWEHSKAVPHRSTMSALARELNTPEPWLAGEDDSEPDWEQATSIGDYVAKAGKLAPPLPVTNEDAEMLRISYDIAYETDNFGAVSYLAQLLYNRAKKEGKLKQ